MRGVRNSRDAQCKVRQGETRSDISAARTPHGGLFITAFQQLTRDCTCSRSSIPAFIHLAHDLAHSLNSHTHALFSYDIQHGRRALSRCFCLPPNLTRETRNKQAIYILRVAIIGYRCGVQFFFDFSFPSSPVFFCLYYPSHPSSTTLFILLFNSKNTGF